ncbi:MAG: AAA family ATPase [Pseudomonadota bacterium]
MDQTTKDYSLEEQSVFASSYEATDSSTRMLDKILRYTGLGYPVHLRGPSGVGKTATAIEAARRIGRPVSFISGSADHSPESLIGTSAGVQRRSTVDRYITSVRKTSSEERDLWIDESLTTACSEGHTMIYDEFHRSPAEATSPLLSVLQERVLVMPNKAHGTPVMPVHPDFRLILTSNTRDELAAGHILDAVMDRLVTLDMVHPDAASEIRILTGTTGIDARGAEQIISIVRDLRQHKKCAHPPSLRAAQMVARAVVSFNLQISPEEPEFVEVCEDVLGSKLNLPAQDPTQKTQEILRVLGTPKARAVSG